ncbi:MAG: biotin--[acetyl-CoA-carboxylase] ligase [Rickettsiaceae bacterium]
MRLDWLKNYNLLIFETVDSTNSEALRLASAGAIGDFVITAAQQTGGRGSKGRSWTSIPGNLHTSVLLNTKAELKRYPQLSFVTANAVYETISTFTKGKNLTLNIGLKWPNDVLINGKKVAGILLESISFGEKKYVVVGIGVNVMESPSAVSFPATSLYDEGIILKHPDEFLCILISKFDRLYKQWLLDNSFARTRKNWLRRAYNLNKVITIDDNARRISGVFKEIDFNGSLQLQLASGQFCNFTTGIVLNEE